MAMPAESWRLVLAGGAAHDLRVEKRGEHWWAGDVADPLVSAHAETPTMAVLALCVRFGLEARQVVPPGEPTLAEARKAARTEGLRERLPPHTAPVLLGQTGGLDVCVGPEERIVSPGLDREAAGRVREALVEWVASALEEERGRLREEFAGLCETEAEGADRLRTGPRRQDVAVDWLCDHADSARILARAIRAHGRVGEAT